LLEKQKINDKQLIIIRIIYVIIVRNELKVVNMIHYTELINTLETIVLRGKKIGKKKLSEKDFKEYKSLRLQSLDNEFENNKGRKISFSLIEKINNEILCFLPSRHKFNSRQRKLIKLVRWNSVARILLGLQARHSSIEYYEKIYRLAKELEETSFLLESSRRLFHHFAGYSGNLKKAEYYYQVNQIANQQIALEIKAEWYLSKMSSFYAKRKSRQQALIPLSKEYFIDLQNTAKKYHTSRFLRIYLAVGSIYFEVRHDYKNLVPFLKEGIFNFQKSYPLLTSELHTIKLHFISYLLKTELNKKAKKECNFIIANSKIQSKIWLRAMELLLLCQLRESSLLECKSTAKAIKTSKAYKAMSKEVRVRIELKIIYGQIFSILKSKDKKALKTLRIGKYINSIPNFSMDKKAMNVTILILQIIYFIIKKDYDNLEMRFESILKYLQRYLRSDNLKRSHCFIKMLLQVHRNNFHPVAINRHTEKHIAQLEQITFGESKQALEVEIIKYEVLWKSLLGYLK